MTDDDLKQFFAKLNGFWPGALNETQTEAWAARVRKVEASEAMSALGDYYCAKKIPGDGKTPSFEGFKRQIRTRLDERKKERTGAEYDDRRHYEAVERGSWREVMHHFDKPSYEPVAWSAYGRWAFARRVLGKRVIEYDELVQQGVTA